MRDTSIDTEILKNLKRNVLRLREAQGLSQVALAAQMKMNRPTPFGVFSTQQGELDNHRARTRHLEKENVPVFLSPRLLSDLLIAR